MNKLREADDLDRAISGSAIGGDQPPSSRLIVPAELCFKVHLARRPANDADFTRLLREVAPLRLEMLVWTEPFGCDGRTVIVMRRLAFEQFLAHAEAAEGIPLQAVTEDGEQPIGPPSPSPNTLLTILIVAGSLVTILTSLWFAQAAEPAVTDVPAAQAQSVPVLLPDFAGVSSTLTQYAGQSVENGTLLRLSRTADGAVELIYTATDPDVLQDEIATNAAMARFQPVSQIRSDAGSEGYRVRFSARDPQSGSAGMPGSPLAAPNAAAAATRAEQALLALGKGRNVEMRLSRADTADANVLRHSLELSGPQADVLALVDDLESGSPTMRLSEWAIAPHTVPDEVAGISLQGTLIVPWREGL